MSRNIILDWSGTVVDDLPPVVAATNMVFADFGRPPMSIEEFRNNFRLPFTEFYAEFLPEAAMEGMHSLYDRFFRGMQDDVKLIPGALEFLEFCRGTGRRVFLLSTIQARHWEEQAGRLGVKHYFERAYVEILDKREKIVDLLREHRLNPRETLFAGDMVHDIETARHGGVTSVAVLSGFDPVTKLLPSKPDVIVPSLGELLRLFPGEGSFRPAPVPAVGGLIFDASGCVLMIRTRKWGGRWGIPGGKIERGENAEVALRREVREETGLELGPVHLATVVDCIDSTEFYRPEHFLLLNYIGRVAGEPCVKLNEEGEECVWVEPKEALKMRLNRPTRDLVEHAISKPRTL